MTGTKNAPFRYCLNTSTIKGQELSLVEEMELIAEAGYDGVEPWVRELDACLEQGSTLEELGQRAADLGLEIPNLIGFFPWAVDDDQKRAEGLEEARRNMDMAAKVGCKLLAAPPVGATDATHLDARLLAERYADLLAIGATYGVRPMLEFWGFSSTLGRLSEALAVAVECGRRDACLLADVFHMYKAGSPYEGLRMVGPQTIGLFHVNDFPAEPPRDEIGDADRVYPGDGVAPLADIFRDLADVGFQGMLSLELFNKTYWQQNARTVAETGLRKMRGAVEKTLT